MNKSFWRTNESTHYAEKGRSVTRGCYDSSRKSGKRHHELKGTSIPQIGPLYFGWALEFPNWSTSTFGRKGMAEHPHFPQCRQRLAAQHQLFFALTSMVTLHAPSWIPQRSYSGEVEDQGSGTQRSFWKSLCVPITLQLSSGQYRCTGPLVHLGDE